MRRRYSICATFCCCLFMIDFPGVYCFPGSKQQTMSRQAMQFNEPEASHVNQQTQSRRAVRFIQGESAQVNQQTETRPVEHQPQPGPDVPETQPTRPQAGQSEYQSHPSSGEYQPGSTEQQYGQNQQSRSNARYSGGTTQQSGGQETGYAGDRHITSRQEYGSGLQGEGYGTSYQEPGYGSGYQGQSYGTGYQGQAYGSGYQGQDFGSGYQEPGYGPSYQSQSSFMDYLPYMTMFGNGLGLEGGLNGEIMSDIINPERLEALQNARRERREQMAKQRKAAKARKGKQHNNPGQGKSTLQEQAERAEQTEPAASKQKKSNTPIPGKGGNTKTPSSTILSSPQGGPSNQKIKSKRNKTVNRQSKTITAEKSIQVGSGEQQGQIQTKTTYSPKIIFVVYKNGIRTNKVITDQGQTIQTNAPQITEQTINTPPQEISVGKKRQAFGKIKKQINRKSNSNTRGGSLIQNKASHSAKQTKFPLNQQREREFVPKPAMSNAEAYVSNPTSSVSNTMRVMSNTESGVPKTKSTVLKTGVSKIDTSEQFEPAYLTDQNRIPLYKQLPRNVIDSLYQQPAPDTFRSYSTPSRPNYQSNGSNVPKFLRDIAWLKMVDRLWGGA